MKEKLINEYKENSEKLSKKFNKPWASSAYYTDIINLDFHFYNKYTSIINRYFELFVSDLQKNNPEGYRDIKKDIQSARDTFNVSQKEFLKSRSEILNKLNELKKFQK